MGIKKILKIILIAVVLFLATIFSFYYGKIQCNRMIDAIRNNDITKLRWISTFSNPNTVSDTLIKTAMSESERYTPLGEACKAGNFEMVKLLVKKGADVNYVPILTEASPLALAAESDSNDNLKIVKFLIEKGADVNFSRNRFDHPACLALYDRELRPNGMEILKLLMERGADPEKNRVLRTACTSADDEAIRYLIEEWGYDASDSVYICLYCYGGGEYSYETFEYFLKKGANPYEECSINKFIDTKCAIDYLRENSPEWAEKLIELAAKYGITE